MKVARQENLARSPNAKCLTENPSRKVNSFNFGSNLTEEKVAPHFYVPRPRVEENSTKTGALQLLGTFPPTVKVLEAAVYQKQAVAYSLKQLRCGMRGG